jgi:hypothetical protein
MFNPNEPRDGKATVWVVASEKQPRHIHSVHSTFPLALEAMDLFGQGVAQEYVIDPDFSWIVSQQKAGYSPYRVEAKYNQGQYAVDAFPVGIDGSTVFGLRHISDGLFSSVMAYGIVMALGRDDAVLIGMDYITEVIRERR